MRRDVFQAIADPSRRTILTLVAGKAMTLNEVAEQFNVSRPAISRHVKILSECGLIRMKQQGRERYCEADYAGLKEVSEWVGHFQVFWSRKLDDLGTFLEKDNDPKKRKKSKKKKKHGK
jgi:DNA-binding transcriptional ArsR family regulator